MAVRGIEIRVNTKEVEEALSGIKNGFPRVATRSINRTMSVVQTAVRKEVAADTNLPSRVVGKSLRLTRATFANLRGLLEVTGRRIPLLAFHARPTRRGVTYRMRGKRGVVPTGFIAQMRSGHRGVFRRRGKPRLPIVELFGPSLPRVAGQDVIVRKMRELAADALDRNIVHEMRFLLETRRAA